MAKFLCPRSLILGAFAVGCLAATPEDCFKAIRNNDLTALKSFIASGDINEADSRGTTPLLYAAAFGSTESVRLLLDAGADVKARNSFGATALIMGASSPAKVALLLQKGADPNAASKSGRTALIIAAGRQGSAEAVRLLLKAGAEVDAADQLGVTALNAAAYQGDMETIRLLLAAGAQPDRADKAGVTPLIGAASRYDVERVRLFLGKGANVNTANSFAGAVRHGNIALTKMTPLIYAAPYGSVDLIRTLLDAGAKVNAQDDRGMTPLMAAVSSDNHDVNVVKALITAGADVNAKDGNGESVLDWARKSGHPETIRTLESAGAKGRPIETFRTRVVQANSSADVRRSVEQAMSLLHRSSAEFFKQSGCVGCHHQPVTARAQASLRNTGIGSMEAMKQEQLSGMNSTRPFEPAILQFVDPGGEVDSVATVLTGMAVADMPANSLSDAAVNYIAGKQHANGSWFMGGISRAPAEESDITRTAHCIRVLRHYGWPARQDEFNERIARARAWLLKAEPRNTYERADLLLGLYWAGTERSELARVAARLKREQHPGGGWSQTKYLQPDPYATGLALYALYQSAQVRPSDAAYRRGVAYLLRTQKEDGSWHVRSRAPKFQPYFQSGFPHDHDQWISSTATAFAVMALAPAVEAPATAASVRRPAARAR